MTIQEAVKLVDGTAKFFVWGSKGDKTGWVKGNGWETKICGNEQRAWEAAAETIAAMEVAA